MKRSGSTSPGRPTTHKSPKEMRKKKEIDCDDNITHDDQNRSMPLDGSSTSRQTGGSYNPMYSPIVEKIQREALKLYSEGNYHLAVKKYTKLIGLRPHQPIYYINRASCYKKLQDYVKALNDSKKSVELDPTFILGHGRVIKCAIALHEFRDMEISVAQVRAIDPTNRILQSQAAKMQELAVHLQNETIATSLNNHIKVLEHIENCLTICPQFLGFKIKKAECLVTLRRFDEAEAFAKEILEQHPKNSEAHYVLGRCFYETDIKKSVDHFEEAFRFNPDCDKSREFYKSAKKFLEKKTEANKAYNSRNFTQAYDRYQKLSVEFIKNRIMLMTSFFNMAQASYKLDKLDRCLEECEKVLSLKPDHLKALMRRAQCHMDQKNFEKAIKDLETASSIKSSTEIQRMMLEARRLLEISKDDFFGILGVVHGASTQVIHKAYKELARVHHPDRHANATQEQKEFHEIKCKEITRAYRLLMERRPDGQQSSQKANDECNAESDAEDRYHEYRWHFSRDDDGRCPYCDNEKDYSYDSCPECGEFYDN